MLPGDACRGRALAMVVGVVLLVAATGSGGARRSATPASLAPPLHYGWFIALGVVGTIAAAAGVVWARAERHPDQYLRAVRGGDGGRRWSSCWRCSSRRRASAARCGRWPTITPRRSRSASRCAASGSSSGRWPASWRSPPASSGAARAACSSRLSLIALKALPVLILGGFTSVPGAIVGGLIIGVGEKVAEVYWGPALGGRHRELVRLHAGAGVPAGAAAGPVRREDHRAGVGRRMFYREAGQFKTSYAADQAIFPIAQDRWFVARPAARRLRRPAAVPRHATGSTPS